MEKTLKIIPLGGLGQIGMNMMVMQYGAEAIIIDCGVSFADKYLPGIDLVVPDFSYLFRDELKPKAVLLTHGHEDHIGALPFLYRDLPLPVYGSRFTLALVKERLKEHDLLSGAKLNEVKEGDRIEVGSFGVEFIQVSHSISDSLALAIETPVGRVIHTGDFKIDPHPADGRTTNLERFKELGKEGVFLLMSDSTNVESPGPSQSETSIRDELEELFSTAPGWVIVATFASHIPRLRQVLEIAMKYGKRVHLSGRSVVQNVGIARGLGYLRAPDHLFIEAEHVESQPREKVVIVSTGSQGESRSSLARMAFNQIKDLQVMPGDRVILSSRMIPGNERAIYSIVNHLYRRGAEVFTKRGADVHVSGHGFRGDLETMLKVTKPKYFIPLHGEYRHLVKHMQVAQETGISKERMLLMEDGDVAEFSGGEGSVVSAIKLSRSVVDGRELGDIGDSVLRDRRQLSGAGMVVVVVILDSHSGEIVTGPELFARGVAFEEMEEDLLSEARQVVVETIEEFGSEARTDELAVQEEVRLCVRRYFKNQLERKPVVIPIVLEV